MASIIFVKKEEGLRYKAIDKTSTVLSFIICFTVLPFVTLVASFIDINGGSPELHHQMLYFFPVAIVLCIAASVSLRRKGYGKASLISCLAGPAALALYLLICGVAGLL